MALAFTAASSMFCRVATPVASGNMPMTFACWFQSTDTTNRQELITLGTGADANNMFALEIRGDVAGDPVYALHSTNNGPASAQALTSTGYTSGVWYHAAAVFASTTDRRAYINGGSKGTSATNVPDLTSKTRTTLAQFSLNVAGSYLQGKLAQAAIWSVALDDAEIAALAKGFFPSVIRPASLAAYWPLARNFGAGGGTDRNWSNSATTYDLTENNTPVITDDYPVFGQP